MGEVRSALREWLGDRSELSIVELKAIAYELIRQPLTEDKLAGTLLLSEHILDELGAEDLPALRRLLADDHLADWNSCDWFSVKVLGRMLQSSPDRGRIADEIIDWTKSPDLWVRRAGLVAFVNLAPHGDAALPKLTERLLTGARRNARDQRRFAQTSVGWVLRELSASEPDAVQDFLADCGGQLSSEARRAAAAKLKV